MQTNNSALHIGVYYGKQEQAPEEQIREEFSKLTTQNNKLKQNGEVILTEDFNAKLEVNNDKAKQNQSRNGKIMADFLKITGLQPISLKANIGTWIRENRNNCTEKSIINYIKATPKVAKQTKNIIMDEIGTLRMKGRKETNHKGDHMPNENPPRSKTYMAYAKRRSLGWFQQRNAEHLRRNNHRL